MSSKSLRSNRRCPAGVGNGCLTAKKGGLWVYKERGSVFKVSLDFPFFNVLVCLSFLAFGIAAWASAVQLSRQEVIQRSSLIFVGSVLEKNARWNEKGNLIVTDYVFAVDDVLWGEVDSNRLTLTFAGGQLSEEGQAVSDVPEFEVGELVLLMIEESDYPLLSPVTGGDQGKFLAGEIDDSGNRVVRDGGHRIIKNTDGKNICFKDFVELVKTEIGVVKAKP